MKKINWFELSHQAWTGQVYHFGLGFKIKNKAECNQSSNIDLLLIRL